MILKTQLLGGVALIALSATLGASGAHAQATAETDLGTGEDISVLGTIDEVNDQSATANVTATVGGGGGSGNTVITDLSTDATNTPGNDTISTASPVTDNAISASGTGNTSDSDVILGFSPNSDGDTAVVGNLQTVETDTISATSTDDASRILVENSGTPVRTFTGAALLDGNDTFTTATGNVGTSRISIDPGVDILEAAAGQASAAIDETLVIAPNNNVSGDLVVSSSQEIDAQDNGASVAITSTVTRAATTANIEDLNSGTVTVSDNAQRSTARGNVTGPDADGVNGIVSGGTTASITGSTVVSNLQSIDAGDILDGITIEATTQDSGITGRAGLDTGGNFDGDVTDSTITVTGNTQSSDATGNDSDQVIALDAANITGEGIRARSRDDGSAGGGSASGVQLSVDGDAMIANVQREAAGDSQVTVTATTSGNTIEGVSEGETTTGSSINVGQITDKDGNVTSPGNRQTASATGARTSNDLSLTSGATQSAAGVVASVQNGLSTVEAAATNNTITAKSEESLIDSSLLTTGNTIGSTATGSDATNALSVTSGTNNLSAGINAGNTLVNSTNTTQNAQPGVVAAQIVTNDQSRSGSVTATSTDNQVTTFTGGGPVSALNSSVTTDGNSVTASATGQTADNGIDLAFNALTGDISGAGTGTVASVANEQDMLDGSSVTARNFGLNGEPVLTDIAVTARGSEISTSDNTVSAIAQGNVTTGNDVIADGTTITSSSLASPSINFGPTSAGGSFVSASAQTSSAEILATQNDISDSFSNTIETGIAGFLADSTLVSDGNELSSLATANTANNSVALGSGTSALIDVSGTVANFQETTGAGSVTAELGLADEPAGVIARIDANSGGFGRIFNSTVSLSDNNIVGEVTGNDATNVVSAEATEVTGPSSGETTINANTILNEPVIEPTGADLATANFQFNESVLSSDVFGIFAIIDEQDDIDSIVNSTQTVSGNLQQSFATGNRATNGVELTASNTDANTALESAQYETASVGASSDMDVVANAGAVNSSLTIEQNRNQSVANGNVVDNLIDLEVTNATTNNASDASIDINQPNAGRFVNQANNVLASDQAVYFSSASVVASAKTDIFNQDVSRPGNTEIVDSDVSLSRNSTIAQATGNSSGNILSLGDADTSNMDRTGILNNNQFVAGGGGSLEVTSTVDQAVSVELGNDSSIPVQSSSLSLDGNSTTALARSNVSNNTLSVDGANIAAGDTSADAIFSEANGDLDGAFILGSYQDNDAIVAATTTQSRVAIDMSNDDGTAIQDSALSLAENVSSATALANTAVNSVTSGANAANVDGTMALGNTQDNSGAVTATGDSAVGVFADGDGTNSSGITGSSVDISGNLSASNALGNEVQNTLSASGGNITSGDPASVNATLDASGPVGTVDANAGNLLLSTQANSGAINSFNDDNTVTIDADADDGNGAAASSSTLSVSGNAVEALATANLAINSTVNAGGDSTASLEATGLVGNFQFNDDTGAVTASASTDTTVTLNGAGAAGALSNSTADVSGNSALALARGNVSQNVLNAEGSNVGTGSGNATVAAASGPDSGLLNASFGVFNEQVQQAAVSATSGGTQFAVNATSGAGGDALNGASASVSGNRVQASAFGNVAINSLTLASLNGGTGNDATAAIFNGQTNSGAITASVTGASIGVFSTGGVTNASTGVAGNSISANAVGNSASSTITRRNR